MKKRIFFLTLIFMSSAFISVQAQFYKYSNDFLNIGVGARSLALSNAVCASTDDVTSAYWNPAGLLAIQDNLQVGAMHSEYFAGIAKYDYAAVAKPLIDKNKTVAFSIIRFAVDDIPNTIFLKEPDGSLNYDNISSFSAADYAFLGSFASASPIEGLKWGVNAKIVHRTVGTFAQSWGIGADAGAQYWMGNFKFGFVAKDITTTFNSWTYSFTDEETSALLAQNNVVPEGNTELTAPKFELGSSYNYKINDNFSVNPEADLELTSDGRRNVLIPSKFLSIDPRIGVEGDYKQTVFLRFGIGNFQRVTDEVINDKHLMVQPNIGVGLHLKKITIDYALTNVGNFSSSLYSHVFSLKIGLNNNATTK